MRSLAPQNSNGCNEYLNPSKVLSLSEHYPSSFRPIRHARTCNLVWQCSVQCNDSHNTMQISQHEAHEAATRDELDYHTYLFFFLFPPVCSTVFLSRPPPHLSKGLKWSNCSCDTKTWRWKIALRAEMAHAPWVSRVQQTLFCFWCFPVCL